MRNSAQTPTSLSKSGRKKNTHTQKTTTNTFKQGISDEIQAQISSQQQVIQYVRYFRSTHNKLKVTV